MPTLVSIIYSTSGHFQQTSAIPRRAHELHYVQCSGIKCIILVSAYRSFSCLATLHTEELQLLFQSQSSRENHLQYKINKIIQLFPYFILFYTILISSDDILEFLVPSSSFCPLKTTVFFFLML